MNYLPGIIKPEGLVVVHPHIQIGDIPAGLVIGLPGVDDLAKTHKHCASTVQWLNTTLLQYND